MNKSTIFIHTKVNAYPTLGVKVLPQASLAHAVVQHAGIVIVLKVTMNPKSGQPREVVKMKKKRSPLPCWLHRATNRKSVLKRTVKAMTVIPTTQGYKPRQHTPTEAECERACTHVPKVRKLTSQDGCVTKSRSVGIVYTGRVRGGYKAYFIIVHIILTRSIMIRVSPTQPPFPKNAP